MCRHDPKEKEQAVKDGLCPICQAQRIEKLENCLRAINEHMHILHIAVNMMNMQHYIVLREMRGIY
jgi:hypothetical protein